MHLKVPLTQWRIQCFLTGDRGKGTKPNISKQQIHTGKQAKTIKRAKNKQTKTKSKREGFSKLKGAHRFRKWADLARGGGTLIPVIPLDPPLSLLYNLYCMTRTLHVVDIPNLGRSYLMLLAELTRQTFTSRNSLKITPRPTSDDECVSVHFSLPYSLVPARMYVHIKMRHVPFFKHRPFPSDLSLVCRNRH